jgi:NAD-dependent deacetylase
MVSENVANSLAERIERLASWLRSARAAVVFTGAGVSTESGIPDFRGPDGLWRRVDPANFTIRRYLEDPQVRRESWERFKTGGVYGQAEPNPAHRAIAELVRAGLVKWVITQNIDSLHHRAGTPPDRIIELHGNLRFAKCLGCRRRFEKAEALALPADPSDGVPRCPACGGLLKSGTVSFGEPLPAEELARAEEAAQTSDLFIVVGSSLVVYPAAYLPLHALDAGASLVIVNLGETPLDHLAHLLIAAPAGKVLPRVADLVLGRPT